MSILITDTFQPSAGGFFLVDMADVGGAGTWKIIYIDGDNVPQELSLGADGTFLQANGASAAPTFAALVAADIAAHGSAQHTGKIGEVPMEFFVILADPLVSAADTTLTPGYEYKDVWGNAVRKIKKWYVKFESNVGGDVTLQLYKNGSQITGAEVTVSSGTAESSVDTFTSEVTMADGDVFTVQQTTSRTDAIQGVAHVYGREEVVTTVTYS